MSVLSEAISALREALILTHDVKRMGETLGAVSHELRDHDRRIIRLEAKWEAAVELSAGRGRLPRRLEDKS